jgi:Ni/Fe-hydrogenase subunit HybB-like protein
MLGFGKACSIVLMGYFVIRIYGAAMEGAWSHLATGYGLLFLVELLGFVALPSFLYAFGVREKNVGIIKIAAVLTVLGVVLNRFIVSLVAFNYALPSAEKYFPSWMEIVISLFIVTMIIAAYRFICTFMPVLRDHPDYENH